MAETPSLTLEDMLILLRKRTQVTSDDPWLVRELNDAQDWTWQNLYLTNPKVQLTFGTTGTLAADSQVLDLTTQVASTIWGISRAWFKGANDTLFVPAVFRDIADPEVLANDQITPAVVIQPVICTVYNFNQLHFANQLPAGTQWKLDWIGTPPPLSLATNAANTSYPPSLNYPTVARAMWSIYDSLDDTRSAAWYQIANTRLSLAMKNIRRRQWLNKTRTRPYPSRQGGAIYRPNS